MRFLILSESSGDPRPGLLADSLLLHHPDADLVTLVGSPRAEGLCGPDQFYPQGLDFDGLRWEDLVLALGGASARWAGLPWILQRIGHRWNQPDTPLVVLEDTFMCFGPLDPTAPSATDLSARALHVDADARSWGGYLPGLLMVPGMAGGSTGGLGPISPWWRDRVLDRLYCSDVDPLPDPWWDLPVGTRTLTDPALRLSASTIGEVELDDVGRTDSGPLVLVDFAGFGPHETWQFDQSGDPTAHDPGESPGLKALCDAHAARLKNAGVTQSGPSSASSGIPGIEITAELRRWYRSRLAQARPSSSSALELPPNPYVAGEFGAFIDQLASPGAPGRSAMGAHVDQVLARRSDLAVAFPQPRWKDRRAFAGWTWSHGLTEGETSLLTLPDPPAPESRRVVVDARRPFGVNLVGYLGAELGLGVAARRIRSALKAAGVPTAEVSYDRTSSRQREQSQGTVATPYEFNLLLITPDQLPLFVRDVGAEFLVGHHNIGLWYWETDVVAPSQAEAFDLVDEIWVATEYLTRAFEGHGKPVTVVPSPLVFDAPPAQTCRREHHGLDDRFTFLFSFDFLSVSERKNPLGLIEAYTRAFPDRDGGTRLLLKSINGQLFPEELAHLRWVAASRPDITVRDAMLDPTDRLGLVAAADCYISLHRSEGLGLTMAEAMSLGTPVIATGYSGNMDFMPEGSVLLVPAREVTVGPGRYYPPHGHWASPDLDVAAAHMRRVRGDEELRHRLARAGRCALEKFSYEAVGEIAGAALLRAWNQR